MLPCLGWETFGNILNFKNFYLFDFKDINQHPSALFRNKKNPTIFMIEFFAEREGHETELTSSLTR